jgi:hypothetical protein
MTRAFGGSRPVGPACEFDYRIGCRGMQYDAVLEAPGRTRRASEWMASSH